MEERQDILFPFGQIAPRSRIVLYGAGDVGQIFYQQIAASGHCAVVGWIDAKWAERPGLPAPFCRVADLASLRYDRLVIALADASVNAAVEKALTAAGVPPDKIVPGHGCVARYALCHPADAPDVDFVTMLADRCGLAMAPLPAEEAARNAAKSPPGAGKKRVYNVALVGTGVHARRMALCLQRRLDNARLYAVASRDERKSRDFAADFGIPRAYASCQALAEDPHVDLVHICTPPEAHHPQTMLLLKRGKNVLCEKPFAANLPQAREMTALARKKGLLLAEAMWPRYLPMADKIGETLRSGIIGRPVALYANLLYPGGRPDDFSENGCYLLALSGLVFGKDVRRLEATVPAEKNGGVASCCVTLAWDDALATLVCGGGVSDRAAYVYGEKGFLLIENANEYKTLSVRTARGLAPAVPVARHDRHSGYEYELRACLEALERGDVETPFHTHGDTLFVMGLLDEIRRRFDEFRHPARSGK